MPGGKGLAMFSHPPIISYRQSALAYFIYDNQVYPVATAPSSIFKEAILALPPSWPTGSAPDATKLLKAKELDTPARWWLLCLLGKARTPLKLYASREAAEKVMVVSVG